MDLDDPQETDLLLAFIAKQDLSDLSVGDLEDRIGHMREDIARCEVEIAARGSTRSAAESLFKS